ncbi:hypothetical protein CMI48_01490 [Candidatus Pacearchaeota archaeon]|nr:hypothetical protein [Candidatus Pacearchaeota archaeon]|tara:strand:+ start:326 stop:640 length:315 start_codon:yes stop_codon:yes gene_type:complete
MFGLIQERYQSLSEKYTALDHQRSSQRVTVGGKEPLTLSYDRLNGFLFGENDVPASDDRIAQVRLYGDEHGFFPEVVDEGGVDRTSLALQQVLRVVQFHRDLPS